MLEITADDIFLLNDGDLRTLVGLLCEAELQRGGHSTSFVTWGGNQNASDGGIDVRVGLPIGAATSGFIPRNSIGFQVKAEDMPAGRIKEEMRPNGLLRESIRALASQSGAYIIVSSKGSTSDSALNNRKQAMADSISDLQYPSALLVDFYDCNRVATWVRWHAGIVLWVRSRTGKPIPGWQSHGEWTAPLSQENSSYLSDADLTIRPPNVDSGSYITAINGINEIRRILHQPRSVVRLIGLSGVGKTRLAQALFEHQVGANPLDPALAVYTNMADEPNPSPRTLADSLIAEHRRQILVVDNCPSELHARLSEICRRSESSLSLLTIEYDIRDDQPEGTDVFEISTSSSDLIEKLLEIRFPSLSQVDVRSVADFAGGNARIAIALASTVEQQGSITGLRDDELFKRLFHQRNASDDSLLRSAQACALVYSFNGDNVSIETDAELSKLAATIGKDAISLFADVAELKRRNLVQQRSVWRAVLPHAIANRLAALALQNIPPTVITSFTHSSPIRLLRSFSRRLGYLDQSAEARQIVAVWLAPDGLLGDVSQLNADGCAMFKNVAPTLPEAALGALEIAHRQHGVAPVTTFSVLLESIAYDPTLFERAATLLAELAVWKHRTRPDDKAYGDFSPLFHIYLSGTHASVEQRLAIIEKLLRDSDSSKQHIGLAALKSVLEAWHFVGNRSFDFGSRSRDYGFKPSNLEQFKHWYASALNLCDQLVGENISCTLRIKDVLAGQLRGLWVKAGMYQELKTISRKFTAAQFWTEGWVAVLSIRRFDAKSFDPNTLAELAELMAILRPKDLAERVRALVSTRGSAGHWGLDGVEGNTAEDFQRQYQLAEQSAHNLGMALASDVVVLGQVLPDLVTSENGQLIWPLAISLVNATDNLESLWDSVVAVFGSQMQRKHPYFICGCLRGIHERDTLLGETLLDNAVDSEQLAQWFPILQGFVKPTENTPSRLKRALRINMAPARHYSNMMSMTNLLSGSDFELFVTTLATISGGVESAFYLLEGRLYSDNQTGIPGPAVRSAGRYLLGRVDLNKDGDHLRDYTLGEVVRSCLPGPEGESTAFDICARLRNAFATYSVSSHQHEALLAALFGVQPITSLNAFFPAASNENEKTVVWGLKHVSGFIQNVFDSLPQIELLMWCELNPGHRYPLAASFISAFQPRRDASTRIWTPLAMVLLDRAPDRIAVLRKFIDQFYPSGWSGSRATIVDANARLLEELLDYPDRQLVEFATHEIARIQSELALDRANEMVQHRFEDERFE